jgi:NADPH-dependent 2,4-dienoyl-CoA reductase/sulfur reductase-like enzyme
VHILVVERLLLKKKKECNREEEELDMCDRVYTKGRLTPYNHAGRQAPYRPQQVYKQTRKNKEKKNKLATILVVVGAGKAGLAAARELRTVRATHP